LPDVVIVAGRVQGADIGVGVLLTRPDRAADSTNSRFPIQAKKTRFHNPFQRINKTQAVLASG
jgi:hypothetical protein